MPSAYIVNNLIANSSVAKSASTEDSVYTLDQLHDKVLGKPFRWTVTTGGWIEFDFGTATAFDTLFIGNHNFNSAAYVLLQVGAAPAPTLGLSAPAWREANIWADLTPQTRRYVRLNVTDVNTAASEIGELVLGARVVLPRARRYGGQPASRMRENVRFDSTRGRPFAYKLFQNEAREYSWRVTEAELQDLRDFDDAVSGDVEPFLWIPDTAGSEAFYARMENSSFEPVEQDKAKVYDVRIRLREESRGVAILA